MKLFWLIPILAFTAYALFRFFAGVGPRRTQTDDEVNQDRNVGTGAWIDRND